MRNKLTFVLALTVCLLFSFSTAEAQIKTPAPSPFSKVEQKVGLTDVTIEYSRPSIKDRKIFGGLVPYGETWRTGANASTKVTFSEPVTVGGSHSLKAGTYALYTIPGEKEWTIIFYTETQHGGVPNDWKTGAEAANFKVTPKKMDMTVETFLINIGHLRATWAEMELIWENTLVEFKLETNTDEKVEKNIEAVMKGTSQNDYYAAARYYLDNDKDLNKALMWIQQANANPEPKFWQVRSEALILAKMGKYDKAIAAAQKSMALAQKAENSHYVNLNKESIAEWSGKKSSMPNTIKKKR